MLPIEKFMLHCIRICQLLMVVHLQYEKDTMFNFGATSVDRDSMNISSTANHFRSQVGNFTSTSILMFQMNHACMHT